MNLGKFVIAAMALLTTSAYGQNAPDLSKDPRLQQNIDVHFKRVLIPELMKFLRSQSDQKFHFDTKSEPLMVCVFAHEQPLWLVMQDVADVLGAQWEEVDKAWRLSMPRETRVQLENYIKLEKNALGKEETQRGNALAALASKNRWSELKETAKGAKDSVTEDETPGQWANRVVHDPAYYIAGIMFSRLSSLDSDQIMWDCRSSFLDTLNPVAFRFIAPETPQIAASHQCCSSSEFAPELAGSQIAVRHCNWAGTLQAVLVDGGSHRAEKPPRLVRLPRPTPELAKTPPGKWLLAWETPLEDSKEAVLDTQLGELKLAPSIYFGGGQGIEDYLEALAEAAKVPVVCDAFRLPVWGKDLPAGGSSLRVWLESLQDSQKCFVKVQNGSVLVRHGGFWDLRSLEPGELILRQLESIAKPGLDEYSELVQAVYREANASPNDHMNPYETGGQIPFFDTQQIPLTKFDSKPIRESCPALAAYGRMNEPQRMQILSGGWVDTHKLDKDPKIQRNTIQWVRDAKGRPVPVSGPTEILDKPEDGVYADSPELYIDFSAKFGVFYGGHPVGFEQRLMESLSCSSFYRRLWGDSPDDDKEFKKTFGQVSIYHAFYLSLRNKPAAFDGSSTDSSRLLTGDFHFFSSISDADGVINDVTIPGS